MKKLDCNIMINNKNNPEEWSTLLYELEDANEHLEVLVNHMKENGCIDKVEYEIQLGHIFAHLNRSWNSRNFNSKYDDKTRKVISNYPTDLEPCG